MQSPSSDVVKVAIQANNKAVLFKLEQSQPLETIIENVCTECEISYEKNRFALQLLPQVSEPDVFIYITEFNRYMIKNGHELRLVYSPSLLARMIQEKLKVETPIEHLAWALKKAATCTVDVTFCKEFFTLGYVSLRALLDKLLLTKYLYIQSLQIIHNLIRSGCLKELDKDFAFQLKQIITSDQHIDEGIIETSLNILEAAVVSMGNSEFLSKLLRLDEFVHHLWSRDYPTIQSSTLALMNSMVLKSSKSKTQKMLLRKMNSKPFKDNIYTNIVATDSVAPTTLAHALYVYQSLILTLDKERYRNLIRSDSLHKDFELNLDLNNTKINEKIENDTQLTLAENENSFENITKDFEELSLSNSLSNQVLDESDEDVDDSVFIPETKHKSSKKKDLISQLTYDCAFHFYNKHKDDYKIALLDEGNNYGHFLQTCELIVQMLCVKVLQIGNIPDSTETSYCPLVFVTVFPFLEELFSKAIILFHKTKREMKARSTTSDLEKVLQVVQRQLQEALGSQPLSYERLDEVLAGLSYSTVRSQWLEEQLERERHALTHSPAVQALQQSLVPETQDLVKRQRLQFLKKGSEFPVWNSQRNQRVKNKTWFACLSFNEKAIQYYENEGDMKQLQIKDITSLQTGRRCPHIKYNKSRATNGELAFSLITEEKSLDFIAPSQEIYDHWTDGINALLGNEMKSITTKRDMNCLLEMEVRLRLLEADGLDLPSVPPPIPLDPPNYDFCQP